MRLKFLLNLCDHQQILWDPSNPSHKNRNNRKAVLLQIIWLAWPDGLASLIFRTEVTKDMFMKWAFDKLAKLY